MDSCPFESPAKRARLPAGESNHDWRIHPAHRPTAFHASGLSKQVEATGPDILLLDWGLPGLLKQLSIEALRRANPGLKVIVLSGQPEAGKEAMLAGADAFVNKTETPEQLLTVIHSCACV